MKNIYKILIVCTFLIGLFFLAKYIWTIWPRYEWQKRIVIDDIAQEPCFGTGECYCQEVEIKECLTNEPMSDKESKKLLDTYGAVFSWDRTLNEFENFCTYWSGVSGEDIIYYPVNRITKTICYIKERIKIN